MLPMDCHTHTGISPDGTGTVAGHAEQAKRLGLPVLALTEHVEMNRYFPQAHYGILPRNEWEIFDHAAVLEHSLQAVAAEKEQAAADGLTLLCGMEMGQPNADFGLSESVAADVRLDFIIASLHELLEKPDFFCLDYQTENIPALMEAYFSQLYDICRWGHFDVLGHLTYPLRYIEGRQGFRYRWNPMRNRFAAASEHWRKTAGNRAEHLWLSAEVRQAVPHSGIPEALSGDGRRSPDVWLRCPLR
ncbi:MAG: PHP domain-containing protein [Ruminococcus sp.]